MLYQSELKLNSQNNQTEYFNRFSVLLLLFGLFCFGYFYFEVKNKTSLRKVELRVSHPLKLRGLCLLAQGPKRRLFKKGVRSDKNQRRSGVRTYNKKLCKVKIGPGSVIVSCNKSGIIMTYRPFSWAGPLKGGDYIDQK